MDIYNNNWEDPELDFLSEFLSDLCTSRNRELPLRHLPKRPQMEKTPSKSPMPKKAKQLNERISFSKLDEDSVGSDLVGCGGGSDAVRNEIRGKWRIAGLFYILVMVRALSHG
ncbi:hypothetical protein OROMI_008678 [Orobanche minor]